MWKTDGTEAGTTVVDLFPGIAESVQRPIELNGIVYMTGITASGETNNLISFDGTTATAVNTSSNDENILASMGKLNGKLLLYMKYAPDTGTIGGELYEFDPSTTTFTLIKDINSGTGSSGISNFTTLNSKVYFEAVGNLWETDGTEAGTTAVSVASSLGGVANLVAFDGKILFEGDNGTDGDQLYVYNPTTDTITNISNISGTNKNHDPAEYVELDGNLYYKGKDADDTKFHLFKTDGTTVTQVDSNIIDVDDLVVFNNKIYFEGDDGSTGNELYVYDPATASTATAEFDNALKVYPNPSTSFLNVQGDFTNTVSYEIYNVIGKKVQAGAVINNRINHNLSSGLYIVNIKNGNSTATRKLVVK